LICFKANFSLKLTYRQQTYGRQINKGIKYKGGKLHE
jgi:hypothetical protein